MSDISLLIPTKNRSSFLSRLLKYYCEVDFKGMIYIGDSSNENYLNKNVNMVKSFNNKLNIIHKPYPNVKPAPCVKLLLELVQTKYSVCCNDDDFLIPAGLDQCIIFLENNPNYYSAHGKAIKIKTKNSMPHGKIITCKKKVQPIEEADKASDRWLHYMQNLTDAQFSVHLTEDFKSIFSYSDIQDSVFSGVILPNCLSIIGGKIKEINCLSLVRHIQDIPYRSREELDTYYWLTRKDWFSNFGNFRDIFANEFMHRDKILIDDALTVVDKGMFFFIAQRFVREWKKYLSIQTLQVPKSMVLNIDMDNVLSSIKSKRFLKSLLKPSSPHHKDFMPIYCVITKK